MPNHRLLMLPLSLPGLSPKSRTLVETSLGWTITNCSLSPMTKWNKQIFYAWWTSPSVTNKVHPLVPYLSKDSLDRSLTIVLQRTWWLKVTAALFSKVSRQTLDNAPERCKSDLTIWWQWSTMCLFRWLLWFNCPPSVPGSPRAWSVVQKKQLNGWWLG